MSSNSIRIDAALFNSAREHGEVMSRSAAQQVEYWARLGATLEASGLTVPELAGMLQQARHATPPTELASEAEMWANKRARQARDLENVRSGRLTNDQMSWFSGGRAKSAKLINSPY